ncbi:tetratricopeptide repeat protein [Undibacterium cyanobacteriorum]|uniref:Tetratricopeptide repeat protein n=1 Tax=Undibacterium cyanobacteriorum TaxID=3073561 RepID=A0ABY9RLP7_9BURK|nr:tetratricopeptide repeat protein [Undibacterium sp. 20NA77.5]WMW82124.1 tetratricopeptide repeat protein [Undibacterium sp. 20NA77.5]
MSEMEDLPAFFIDQRLDFSADERTIKRAYAKALKQIDQETDLNGFQDLRESYEYAIAWARHRDWRAAQEAETQEQTQVETPVDTLVETQTEIKTETKTETQIQVEHHDESQSATSPEKTDLSTNLATISASNSGSSSDSILGASNTDQDLEAAIERGVQAAISQVNLGVTQLSTEESDRTSHADGHEKSPILELAPEPASVVEQDAFETSKEPAADLVPALPDPTELAREVYDAVLQKVRESNNDDADLGPILQEAMDDDRLINVEARDVFEWMMAHYVAQGWQPGNGNLFGATVKCFQWNQDRNRLLRFGELGYFLDHALIEMSSFNDQDRALADRQVFLIRRARDASMPDKAFFKENIGIIHYMGSNFPNWLSLVTSWTNLQAWRERAAELKIEPKKVEQKQHEDDDDSIFSNPRMWIFIAMIVIGFLRTCANDTNKRTVMPPTSMETIANAQRMASERLSPEALMYQAGEDAFFGRDGVKQDYHAAEQAWLQCAEKEHLDCISRLADLYSMSKTGMANPESAHLYRERAAERGRTRMYFELANDYILGRGIKKNDAKAFSWTKKAVEAGEPAATHNLAYLYEHGIGVKKNAQLAWDHYVQAADAGVPIAMRKVGVTLLTGQLHVAKDENKGMEFLKKSAAKNYGQAEFDLGTIYEKGLYKQAKDVEQATQWYARAAQHSHEEASKKLGTLCKSNPSSACKEKV